MTATKSSENQVLKLKAQRMMRTTCNICECRRGFVVLMYLESNPDQLSLHAQRIWCRLGGTG